MTPPAEKFEQNTRFGDRFTKFINDETAEPLGGMHKGSPGSDDGSGEEGTSAPSEEAGTVKVKLRLPPAEKIKQNIHFDDKFINDKTVEPLGGMDECSPGSDVGGGKEHSTATPSEARTQITFCLEKLLYPK